MREPRRDHYLPPGTGEDTEAVLQEAIAKLGERRGFAQQADAASVLHLLASLLAEAEQQLPRAIAQARQEECSWAEIGDLLGVSRASAHQRYSGRPSRQPAPPGPGPRHGAPGSR